MKRLQKARRKEAAAKTIADVGGAILGSLVDSTLRQNTMNFINSAPMMNEKIQFKLANRHGQKFLNDDNAIAASGKSDQMFFFDRIRRSF